MHAHRVPQEHTAAKVHRSVFSAPQVRYRPRDLHRAHRVVRERSPHRAAPLNAPPASPELTVWWRGGLNASTVPSDQYLVRVPLRALPVPVELWLTELGRRVSSVH